MSDTQLIHYLPTHLDSLSITQSLTHLVFAAVSFMPSKADHAVLVGLRHSDQSLHEASLEENPVLFIKI